MCQYQIGHSKKGTKRVEIAGLDDKRHITVLLSCTMDEKVLPTLSSDLCW